MAFTPIDPNKAEVRITGTAPNYGLDFYIPRGERGEIGPQGPIGPTNPTNLSIGIVETGPETPGATGPQGLKGDKGDPGGIAVASDLGNNDLNGFIVPGIYRQTNGAYTTLANNYPSAGGIGLLTVLASQSDNSRFEQTWDPVSLTEQGSGRVFYRRVYYSGTWYPWKAYNSSRVDQTAGRVLYEWDPVNQREQLVYGDTGWRSVRASVSAEWDPATTNMDIRRVGSNVYLSFDIYPATANVTPSSGSAIYTLPSGFGPAIGGSRNDYIAYCETASSATPVPIVTRVNAGAIDVLLASRAPANLKFIRGHFSWPTNAAWPTSLPGTANGTIPNT